MVKHAIKKKVGTKFDTFVLAVAIVEPMSTIPQIYDVYATKDARSLSLLSWVLFATASLTWLLYGLKIKNVPLIASSILWVSTELILIVGIFLYS